VCVFAEGEVDRSPTGTGVSARAALLHDTGKLRDGETIVIESILGTCFGVTVVGRSRVGSFSAVVPEVSGEAYVTGTSAFFAEPEDPLRDGFIFR
jgi:trans-L-3-hydroxyproline dehydratase